MNTFLQTVGALNDETRLKILRFIDENGAVCVCDIEGEKDAGHTTLYAHP
jgi:ArsR family transcriptional regulator